MIFARVVKKSPLSTLLLAALFCLFSVSAHAYSGGSGTEADPYQIANKADLLYLGTNTADYSKHFIMTADIDLAGEVFDEALIDTDWLALFGFPGVLFTGILDGGGFVVSNFTVNVPAYECGGSIVGCIDSGGVIKNLGVKAFVYGEESAENIGGLCGYNRGVISNCFFSGVVGNRNYDEIGGLCGYSEGNIVESYSCGVVHNALAGAGGLCGGNKGLLKRCWSSCSVFSGQSRAGGLCAVGSGEIIECFASGQTVGKDYVGGLCGMLVDSHISNSYASGDVVGRRIVGGLCGGVDKDFSCNVVSNCYSVGAVSATSDSGGLCGIKDWMVVDRSYFYLWSGLANGLGVPLDQNELTERSSFSGFDFSDTAEDGTNDVWTIVEGHCPKLAWQEGNGPPVPPNAQPVTTLSGSGLQDAPFVIEDLVDFYEFSGNTNLDRGFFRLEVDIDLAETNFEAAVVNRDFGGFFDGNGHRIFNVAICVTNSLVDELGLFSRICGSVSKLGVESASVLGGNDSSYVGILCGYNLGRVNECFSSGIIEGNNYVGGICGANSGKICDSASSANVSGESIVGGFCGIRYNLGLFEDCYSIGSVDGNGETGGFCAKSFDVTAVMNCFWDIDTSGNSTSDGGTGRTTAEMQTQSTFTDAGWDFANVWYMDGYPALRCFNPSGTYEFWLMNNTAIPATLRGMSDIPASDSIPNLIKYACGLPAMDACTTADLMMIDPGSSNIFSVLYYKSKTAQDVVLQPVWAESLLGPWSALGVAAELVGEDAEREQWKASIPVGESGFIRLRATAE